MKNIDDAIREAVSKEDAEFLSKLENEPGSLEQIAGILQGPLNWLHTLFLIVGVIAGIFGVYSGWQFAIATDLRPLFYWGAVAGFCLAVLVTVRIIFFMQLNTNRVLRELKRLELQIALLASKKVA
jgi:uncharacterized membrane protein YciS (DUF1049 family)